MFYMFSDKQITVQANLVDLEPGRFMPTSCPPSAGMPLGCGARLAANHLAHKAAAAALWRHHCQKWLEMQARDGNWLEIQAEERPPQQGRLKHQRCSSGLCIMSHN